MKRTINSLAKRTACDHSLPNWVLMIQDFVNGAGYSYSRIAHRINVSPSTIQKLATHPDRTPQHVVYNRLLALYNKVFFGECPAPSVVEYLKEKERQASEAVCN